MAREFRILLVFVLSIFFSCILVQGNENNSVDLQTLQFLQIIMRHGDRNFIQTYPTDPYKDESLWEGGFGQLTQKGVEQTEELGRFVRARYEGFLDKTYNQYETLVMSSVVDRAIRSALSMLRGLYPDPQHQNNLVVHNCSSSMPQVVSLRTVPKEMDSFIAMDQPCPRFKQIFDKYMDESQENTQIEKKNKHIAEKIAQHSGIKYTSFATLNKIGLFFDTIEVQRFHNKTLPEWISEDILEFIDFYFNYRLEVETRTDEMKKFRSPLVKKIISNMLELESRNLTDKHGQTKRPRKLIFFSGHDRTIISFLNVLGMYNHIRPPYTTTILIETHKKPSSGDYYVEFFYRNTTAEPPYKLEVPDCPSPCFVKKLNKLMSKFYIEDYNQECKLNAMNSSVKTASFNLVQFGIIFAVHALYKASQTFKIQ